MNFRNAIILLLYSFAFFQGFRGETCDPKPMIIRHEGKKECVYLDTKGIKTIGVGYNMQNKEAPAVFASIGADYNKFISGPVTKWNVPCKCSYVPCLNEGQIEELLDISLKTAIADAQKVIPTFTSLCCPVQNVMVDMSFTFGGPGFAKFTTFSKLVGRQYWKAAGDDLTVSLWCVQATSRCMEDANIVRSGCSCSQPYPQSCDSEGSACCASNTQETCCKGTLTFKSKTFDEQLCCPHPKATCCEHDRCCPQDSVCCPAPPAVPTYCCPLDYPVCKDGKCYRARDGHMIKGKPVAQGFVST